MQIKACPWPFFSRSPLSKGRQLWVKSPGDVKGHGALPDVLKHGDGLAVGHPLEHLAIDGEDLITCNRRVLTLWPGHHH